VFPLRYGIVLVAALVFVACGDSDREYVYSPPEIELEFTGTVISSLGQPIDRVHISYYDTDGWPGSPEPPVWVAGSFATTEADGSYRMARLRCGVRDGPHHLTAYKQGWIRSEPKPVTECFQKVNFVLDPVPPSATGR
jgi:hypothetical protein